MNPAHRIETMVLQVPVEVHYSTSGAILRVVVQGIGSGANICSALEPDVLADVHDRVADLIRAEDSIPLPGEAPDHD